MAQRHFNPGNGGVSRLCHEPKVALAVLTELLAPYCSSRRLLVLFEHEPIRVEVHGRSRSGGRQFGTASPASSEYSSPRIFLDATELGDLLPLAGVEHVIGAEGQTSNRGAPRP